MIRRGAVDFSRRALSRGVCLFVSVSFALQTDLLLVFVWCLAQYKAYSCYHTFRLSRALCLFVCLSCLFVCLGIDTCFTFMTSTCVSHLHTTAAPAGGNTRHSSGVIVCTISVRHISTVLIPWRCLCTVWSVNVYDIHVTVHRDTFL